METAMLQSIPQSNAKPFLIHARTNLCPIQASGRILGKKWYLVIIHRLLEKKMGFNELKEAVGSVSAKILAQALQDLQEKGIVERRLASESPVRVEYSLSPKGEDLRPMMVELESWGRRWDVCKDVQEAEKAKEASLAPPTPGPAPAATDVPQHPA